MTWENQEDARVADTGTMDEEEFATSTNTTQQLEGAIGAVEDVTDDDIERAIAEIQDAIRQVTRCASSTGAMVALSDAVAGLRSQGLLATNPVRDFVAAVSVGIVQGRPVLDLDYAEDSACGTDMNVVMTGAGHFVEVQGTAEGEPFSRAEVEALLALGEQGITELIAHQRRALAQ